MKKDISIILPSIRPQNLVRWYNATEKACQYYSWEVVIVSPYNLPTELDKCKNIKFIKSDRNPTICKQMGILLCNAEFLLNQTDDAMMFPNSMDYMIDLWNIKRLNQYDIINARYREGVLDVNTLQPLPNMGPEFPPEYWTAWHHADLRQPNVDKNFKISLHFMMKLETFYQIGGFHCEGYEYSVFPILEMCFRLQHLGGKIIDSQHEVSWDSYSPGDTDDHAPVNQAMAYNDLPLFKHRMSSIEINNRFLFEQYDNWKKFDIKWERRFK